MEFKTHNRNAKNYKWNVILKFAVTSDFKNLNNKYFKWYLDICNNAKTRIIEDKTTYTERHHIYPVSIYGNNKDIVILIGREHFIVHHLLWWAYRKEYGASDYRTKKMQYAFSMIGHCDRYNKRYKIKNGFEYEQIKQARAEAFKGRIVSQETRDKMSIGNKGKRHGPLGPRSDEVKAKISKANKGRVVTEETREKIRLSGLGHVVTEETKAKISATTKGISFSPEEKARRYASRTGIKRGPNKNPMSEETKQKISISLKGKPLSEEHKRKLSEHYKNLPKEYYTERGRKRVANKKRKMENDI